MVALNWYKCDRWTVWTPLSQALPLKASTSIGLQGCPCTVNFSILTLLFYLAISGGANDGLLGLIHWRTVSPLHLPHGWLLFLDQGKILSRSAKHQKRVWGLCTPQHSLVRTHAARHQKVLQRPSLDKARALRHAQHSVLWQHEIQPASQARRIS
jgi:hypothetical protein